MCNEVHFLPVVQNIVAIHCSAHIKLLWHILCEDKGVTSTRVDVLSGASCCAGVLPLPVVLHKPHREWMALHVRAEKSCATQLMLVL